jgi:2-polyprenyl-3-methyl-5-hydroxy-6-metoxy-1,4-benzoquinol methylase
MREIERCPICRNSERVPVYAGTLDGSDIEAARRNPYGAHYQINRCLGCGLTFSSPIFDDADIAALYEHAPNANVMSGEEANVKKTMRLYYELAKPHLLHRERILDIGCDIGLMLEFAREDGFRELIGLEPNPVARLKAVKIPGAVVYDRFYEALEFADASFDLITFIHVIDHVIDPSSIVERSLRHLKPGGLVITVVHNIESLLARLLGERFPPFNLYHHYFFSKRTLARLFESRGFQVLKVVSTPNCYSLGFFARHAPGIPDRIRASFAAALDSMGLAALPLTIPVGNIGIVARRPAST